MNDPNSGSGSNGAEKSAAGAGRVYEQGRRVGSEARELASDIGELGAEVERFLRKQVDVRPYATLAAAAGAGYILAAGVPPWLFRAGFAFGGRLLVGAILKQVVEGAVDEAATAPPQSGTP